MAEESKNSVAGYPIWGAAVGLLLLVALSGCGQKGNLVLPTPTAATHQQAASAPSAAQK